MKIEGISIQIIAGPYVYSDDDDEPAFIDPVYVENGEINMGDLNKVPVTEIKYLAGCMANRMMQNHIRGSKYGVKRNSTD